MYTGFDSTINKILGTNKPKRDKYKRDMSQENWEKANRLVREHKFSTSPKSARRLIVSPYTRMPGGGRPEAMSKEGKTMAMRLEAQNMSKDEAEPLGKELDTLMDVKLEKSRLFKDVVRPFGSRKKTKSDDGWESI
jgi:hypothetical protein